MIAMRYRLFTIASLFLVLLALVAWDRALAQRESEARHESVRVRDFMDISMFEERPILGFLLESGHGRSAFYAFEGELWRCYAVYGAPAIPSLINPILTRVLEASGYVQSRDREAGSHYGFDQPDTLLLAFCGEHAFTDPEGDIIHAIEIGRSIKATGGSYVRPLGSDEIWIIDDDFRDVLEFDPESPLPPMVDTRVIPEAWPGTQEGVRRITIERGGRLHLELRREDLLLPALAADDAMQWQWIAEDESRQAVADTSQVFAFVTFLMRVEYAGLPGPQRRAELGFEDPHAVVSLESAGGRELRLVFGGSTPRGGVGILNTYTDVLYELPVALVEHFFPGFDLMLSMEEGNPWYQWQPR